jgi:hypothetical protein
MTGHHVADTDAFGSSELVMLIAGFVVLTGSVVSIARRRRPHHEVVG